MCYLSASLCNRSQTEHLERPFRSSIKLWAVPGLYLKPLPEHQRQTRTNQTRTKPSSELDPNLFSVASHWRLRFEKSSLSWPAPNWRCVLCSSTSLLFRSMLAWLVEWKAWNFCRLKSEVSILCFPYLQWDYCPQLRRPSPVWVHSTVNRVKGLCTVSLGSKAAHAGFKRGVNVR